MTATPRDRPNTSPATADGTEPTFVTEYATATKVGDGPESIDEYSVSIDRGTALRRFQEAEHHLNESRAEGVTIRHSGQAARAAASLERLESTRLRFVERRVEETWRDSREW